MDTPTQTTPLEAEREFFAANQTDWKAKYPGKFVLVKGQSLIDTFEKAEDAITEGLERFAGEPFLVRNVEQSEELFLPALAFGILKFPSSG